MQKLNLQQFAGSLTVTIMKDDNSHWTTASASPASSLAKDDEVSLTVTPASGYEVDEIEVLAGGVTVSYDADDGYSLVMGESNVTLFFKAKKNNLYKIVEDTRVWVNGTATELKRNMILEKSASGAVVGAKVTGSTEVSIGPEIAAELVKTGALVKI